MASLTEEYVIEIEGGVGDPPFLALVRGVTVSPLSVGAQGMWRIDAPRVLDVHAYLYFDGSVLHVQSADEERPALLQGRAVGKQWVGAEPPCRIDLGGARLHVRAHHTSEANDDSLSEQQTVAVVKNPLARPFRPGELAPAADSTDLTQYKPMEFPPGSGASPSEDPSEADLATRVVSPFSGGSTLVLPGAPVRPDTAYAPPHAPPVHDPRLAVTALHGAADPLGGTPPPPTHLYGSPAFPPMGAPAGAPAQGARPAGGAAAPRASQWAAVRARLLAWSALLKPQLLALSWPKRIALVVLPLSLIYVLFFLGGDEPRRASPVAKPAPGAASAGATKPTASAETSESEDEDEDDAPTPAPSSPPSPSASPSGRSAAALASGQRTLERQAADLVASGQYEKAAFAYDQLARQYPDRQVFRDAARILRAKFDAGAP